jgi:DNA-binding transcriptional MocR family regulator
MEDDAYGELHSREPPPSSPFSLAGEKERQGIVHVSIFSKSLAPGLRLGSLSASLEFSCHVVVVKQSSGTHDDKLSQLVGVPLPEHSSLEPAA